MKARYQWLAGATLIAFLAGLSLFQNDWRQVPPHAVAAFVPESDSTASEPLSPLPLTLPLDARKVALGDRLFHETSLSGDGTVACASCHNLKTGGVDRLPRSKGIGGQLGAVNAPTVFNSGFNYRQFWDARARTLEDQVDGPLQHPLEMAGTWRKTLDTLAGDAQYRREFAALYRDGITPPNVKDAIATFERSLFTPNSRFDLFLRGSTAALSDFELAGYRLFKQVGCTSCHQGVNIGGNMVQKLGIIENYFAGRNNLTEADQGRFNITHLEEDRFVFRVPSLRNVAITPPYLHDASAPTLEDAVRIMARYQLGVDLNPGDIAKISAFLATLTGEYKGSLLQ
jgi:cytochrome c peroxidase